MKLSKEDELQLLEIEERAKLGDWIFEADMYVALKQLAEEDIPWLIAKIRELSTERDKEEDVDK